MVVEQREVLNLGLAGVCILWYGKVIKDSKGKLMNEDSIV